MTQVNKVNKVNKVDNHIFGDESEAREYWETEHGGDYKDMEQVEAAYQRWVSDNNLDFSL